MGHTLLTCGHTLRLRLERQAAVLMGCPSRWPVISLRGLGLEGPPCLWEERRMAWGQSLRGEGKGRCL